MKSTTFVAILFALSVLIMVVSGQDSSSTNTTTNATSTTSSPPPPASTVDENPIDQCIKQFNCGTDQDCRAKCANVPNPSNTEAQNTDDCVSKCNQNDTNAYAQCKQNCISSNYYSPSATPNSDSAASTNAPPSSSSSQSASGSSSSSGSSTPSSTSKSNSTNGASSFTTNSNAFTALVLCVIAGVMAIS